MLGQVLAVVAVFVVVAGIAVWRVWDDVRQRVRGGADPESLTWRARWLHGRGRDR